MPIEWWVACALTSASFLWMQQAGDDVVVSGVLTRRWGRVARGARFDTEVVIRANHIRLNNTSAPSGVLTEGMLLSVL